MKPSPESDEAWRSILPSMSNSAHDGKSRTDDCLDGLGVVQHPVIGPEIVNLAFVHQLHCLVSHSHLQDKPLLIRPTRPPYARTTSPVNSAPRQPRRTSTWCTVWTTSARHSSATSTRIWNFEWRWGHGMRRLQDTASTSVETLIGCFVSRRNGGFMMARMPASGSRSRTKRQSPVELSTTTMSHLEEIQNLNSRTGIIVWGDLLSIRSYCVW